MIQRIQTLYLLLITIISVLLLFVPFVRYSVTQVPMELTLMPTGIDSSVRGLIYLPVALNLICFVLSIYIIMQYKRRVFQMKMTNLLMALGTILLAVMLTFEYVDSTAVIETREYLVGAFLPIVSIVAAFLASRSIKKDEELVRSADRLR